MEVGGTLQIHLLCFFPMVDQIPTINERGCGLPLPFSQRPVSVLLMAFHWLTIICFFFSFGIQIKPPHGTKASTITDKRFVKKKLKKKHSYWQTVGVLTEFFFSFSFAYLFVWLFYMVRLCIFAHASCSCDYNENERNMCMCSKLPPLPVWPPEQDIIAA